MKYTIEFDLDKELSSRYPDDDSMEAILTTAICLENGLLPLMNIDTTEAGYIFECLRSGDELSNIVEQYEISDEIKEAIYDHLGYDLDDLNGEEEEDEDCGEDE